MASASLTIPRPILDQMLTQAQHEHPRECCGLLAGHAGRVSKIYRMTNTHQSATTYFMDPREQFAAFKEMRAQELALAAIYHSHPHTPAYPSPTDVQLAFYPDSVYVIVSLANPAEPVVRAFQIRDQQVIEVPLEITPD